MAEPSVDHRRAIADRNVDAILDAVERLLEQRAQPSIAAVAAEAGVSRPTVYAHFPDRRELLEATVERAVLRAGAALDAAEPERGPPMEALDRVVAAGWSELHRNLAIAGTVQLDPTALRRTHDAAQRRVRALVDRGREERSFRDDLPAEWLVTTFFALMHAAGDEVRAGRVDAEQAPELVAATLRDVFAATPAR